MSIVDGADNPAPRVTWFVYFRQGIEPRCLRVGDLESFGGLLGEQSLSGELFNGVVYLFGVDGG